MNTKCLIALIIVYSPQFAQAQDFENPFAEAFEDMFEIAEPVFFPQSTPPPPPVPLDGGLVALLVAGGSVAYKKYRSTKKL